MTGVDMYLNMYEFLSFWGQFVLDILPEMLRGQTAHWCLTLKCDLLCKHVIVPKMSCPGGPVTC